MATPHSSRHVPMLQCPVGMNPNEKTARLVLLILCTKQRTLFLKEIHEELLKLRYAGIADYQFMTMLDVSQLSGILRSYPDNFALIENSQHQTMVKPQIKIELCRIHCSKNGSCVGRPNIPCDGLHVCKFYILGSCKQKDTNCKYGHNLSTQHNIQILQDHLLDHLKEVELKYLLNLAVNRSKTTAPQICKFYNVEKGCINQKEGKSCPYLHLCKHYIMGDCRYKGSCKRNHDLFVPDVKSLLERYKIDTTRTEKEIIAELREVLGRDEDDSRCETNETSDHRFKTAPSLASKRVMSARNLDSELSVDTESQETNICLYNLRGQCWFKDLCQNVHKSMPYQWQIRYQSDREWVDLKEQDNLDVELKFSNPACDGFIYVDSKGQIVRVFFEKMEGETGDKRRLEIRRLSTVSSEAENQPLATRWHWFWQDELGKWIEYGSKLIEGPQDAQSCIIEGIEGPESAGGTYRKLEVNSNSYKNSGSMSSRQDIDLRTMTRCKVRRHSEYVTPQESQEAKKKKEHSNSYKNSGSMSSRQDIDLRTMTRCKVRRHSEYVTPQESQEAKKKKEQVAHSAKGAQGTVIGLQCPVPETWSVQSGQDVIDIFNQVEVKKTSDQEEYRKVETLFVETMKKKEVSITSIQRIENGELWTNYYMKKLKMKRKNPDIQELYLFHGTYSKYTDAICHQGFDFRLSGMATGTKFGKGSYFAKTAQYSDCYTEHGKRVMFVVKVLAGDYTTGEKNYRRPPLKDQKNPHSDLYDSCVDNVKNPQIFVVFDNCQVYPEYVIKYSENSTLV